MMNLKSGFRLALLLLGCSSLSACYDDWWGPYSINWYVDPVFGSDTNADGSPYFPFKTLGRALSFAIPGDGVILATGTYSTSSGEVFPILVRPGVFILGDPGTRGSTTVVLGSGSYTIQGGTQMGNIVTPAFVMGGGAQLRGVKVTAGGVAGIGVVFDGNSGSVISCTLTGCGASGLQIYQAGSATLSDNVISSNTATGITVFDTASPNLRLNQILNNGTDGLLANDTSAPNLGDTATAGANTLQGNTGVGLNNQTTASTIQASGNTWELSTQGSDGAGHYATGGLPTTGPVLAVPGNNYAISAGGAIQF